MTFLFIVLRLGPVDPIAARFGDAARAGGDADRMREQLGLNDPLWEQYLGFMYDLLFFRGESWVTFGGQSVREVFALTAPNTLWLGFWAILLPLFIGIPLGMYAGLNPNTKGDYFASASGIIWLSMPNFWLCVMALAALRQTRGGVWLGFDVPNITSIGFTFDWYTFGPTTESVIGNPGFDWLSVSDFSLHALAVDIKLILPAALILGSASMAAELRISRTAVLETINSNYVETAKAKGVRDRVIVWKHVFRNALIPLVPVITNEAFLLIGGSVIVEAIFNINGLGRAFFQAMIEGDLPLAGSIVFLFTVIVLALNIFQDFLYTIIDPRVGYDQ